MSFDWRWETILVGEFITTFDFQQQRLLLLVLNRISTQFSDRQQQQGVDGFKILLPDFSCFLKGFSLFVFLTLIVISSKLKKGLDMVRPLFMHMEFMYILFAPK